MRWHQDYIAWVMVLHKIDKAVRLVKGERNFDPEIWRIWERVLGK